MFTRLIPFLIIGVFLFCVTGAAQIVIEDRVAFTVADAPWIITLDSKNLDIKDMQIKHDNKSGYFLLANEKDNLTVSLFIEPAVKCKTGAECRDFVWKSGNPEWGKLQDVVQSKIGDADYFEFFRPTVQNQPLQVQDMYAEFVENGYWVDLHLSKVQYKKEDHLLFESFVKSIRFVAKTGKPTGDQDRAFAAAQKAKDDWALLWDSGKSAESYKALSTFSQKAFDEKVWLAQWATARKPLGKLKSRKLINFSLIKSLPGLPDSAGAIFKYQSSFENREAVFETFSLILEKAANWRVAGYETND